MRNNNRPPPQSFFKISDMHAINQSTHRVRDEGLNNPVMLLNEDNSDAKLTSHLITGDFRNGLRQHTLFCIRTFTVSIYFDSELEAKWLFKADTKLHAA